MNWIAVIIAGFATYLSRMSFIAFGDKIELPPIVESALKFVAPAAFAAISVPIVLGGNGFDDFSGDLPRIIAASIAGAVMWKSTNLAMSLITGMGTLWLLIWMF